MALNSDTDLALINTNANAGSITLPDTSISQGRVITFKDSAAKFGTNALTLNTTGSDTFEDGSTSKILQENNGIIQLVASGSKWYVLTGTQQNTLNVSTLQALNVSTISISTTNLLVSSLQLDAANPIYQQSSLVYYNSNVFAGSRVYPQTTLNRYIPSTLIFNPNSISNLSYWFDASVSSSMVVDSASTIRTWYSVSTVNSFPRNISNIITMTGPTTSNRGLYAPNSLNGFGGVNLSTSFLTTANITNQAQNYYYFNNSFTNNSEFTNICVINRLAAGFPSVNQAPIHFVQTGGNVRIGVNLDRFVYNGPQGSQILFITAPLCNTPTIYTATRNGGTMTTRLNGVITTTNFTSDSFGTRNFQFMFGTNSYNEFYQGNLHEFVQYQRALSSDDIFRLEGYVAWKWNIQTSLISSHPFRYTPPY
jgi:hypothetical protein